LEILKYINIIKNSLTEWFRFDRWWSKKTELEKLNLRKNFFIFSLLGIAVYQYVNNKVEVKIITNDFKNEVSNCNKELNTIKSEETERMRIQISKYEIKDSDRINAERQRDSALIVISMMKKK